MTEIGPLTTPSIARELDVSRQAAQRLVSELLASGHVTTTANPTHRRSQLINTTRKGFAAFAAIRDRELRMLAELAPEVSTSALDAALEAMSAVARDIRLNARARHDPRT